MEFDKKTVAAFEDLLGQLKEEFSDIKETLEKVSDGDLTEEEALVSLLSSIQKSGGAERISEIATASLAPLREDERPEARPDDMSFQTSTGIPSVNPLYHAALMERLQFDGDAPEHRTGPMVEGTLPAVSVDSEARNPVALGHMLQQASEETCARILEHKKEQLSLLENSSDETRSDLVKTEEDLQSLMELPEYKRGSVPAPVVVQPPSGSSLALMTAQECKEKAWKFFSTTQGRNSAVNTIAKLISDHLVENDFNIPMRSFEATRDVDILAHHEWSADIFGKEDSVQSSFAVLDNAAMVIGSSVVKSLIDQEDVSNSWIEVVSVNTVDVRKVGWAARVVRDKK
jgi:hypothetical protein